jgi:hypothetical protein
VLNREFSTAVAHKVDDDDDDDIETYSPRGYLSLISCSLVVIGGRGRGNVIFFPLLTLLQG